MTVRVPRAMPTIGRWGKLALISIGVLLALFLVLPPLVSLYIDRLWFQSIGFGGVFSTILWTRVGLYFAAALVIGGIAFISLFAAYKARPVFVPVGAGDPLGRYREFVATHMKLVGIVPPVLFGAVAGLMAQGDWQTVQVYLNGETFDIRDPEFGYDIGWFTWDVPFYQLIVDYLFIAVVLAFAMNLLAQYVLGGIQLAGKGSTLTRGARAQLATIAGMFLLLKAVSYWLDRFTLLGSTRKQEDFSGATYTDINAVLPSKFILMAIAVICAVAFFAAIVLRDLRIPALATGLMVLSALVLGTGWPLIMEQFQVKPNAATKEADYIGRNIDATKLSYGLTDDKVTYQRDWAARKEVTPQDAAAVNGDEATLANLRLLDPNVLGSTFTRENRERNFYGFPDQLSVDRYTVNGKPRDYVVAVRELNPETYAADQQTWINKHTRYTHGDGFVAAPANTLRASPNLETEEAGLPRFSTCNLTGCDNSDIALPNKVTQPRIYYGQLIAKVDPDYAIVGKDGGEDREYDTDSQNYTHSGGSGVALGNIVNKLAFAVQYGERNFILSSAINKNSKILFERDPRDRVKKAAPWLTVDSKSYPVVFRDGSIKWIVDGYTTLDQFPYAQRVSLQDSTEDTQEQRQGQTGRTQADQRVSYIRNSVKATVDAYTGEVSLYQFDESDPVLKTWMKIFPDTVKSKAEFGENRDLVEHVRYPEDLFKVQRSLLTRYHVDNPQTFYQGSERWEVPADPTVKVDAGAIAKPQPSYYVLATDQADTAKSKATFQLTTTLTARGTPTLSAYISANSDPENYGRIIIKQTQSTAQPDGPNQAQDKLTGNPAVAANLGVVQQAATVTFGNLLTLPVGRNGVLYIEPVYTQAKNSDGAVPKVSRVLATYDDRSGTAPKVGYKPTVAEALEAVGITPPKSVATIPGAPPAPNPTTPNPTTPNPTTPTPGGANTPEVQAAMTKVGAALTKLKKAQQDGDFAVQGQALQELDDAVKEYQKATGQGG